MTKAKYTSEEMREKIDEISGKVLTYEELMQNHGIVVVWVKHKLDNQEVQKALREIKRRALNLTIRKLSREGPIGLKYIQDNYPGLERVARELYPRNEGDTYRTSFWRRAVEDAGVKYSSPQFRKWSLKKVLEEISANEKEVIRLGEVGMYEQDSGLVGAAGRYAGCFGKAVLMTGIDFLLTKRLEKKAYTFREEEIMKVWENEDMSKDDKIKYLFNILSLQFYEPEKISSLLSRQLDKKSGNFEVCQELCHFDGQLEILLEQSKDKLCLFRVSANLKATANRFNHTGFYFMGDFAGLQATNHYYHLNSITQKVQNEPDIPQ